MNCKAVLLDFIGTTVIEKSNDVITACFEKAFRENGVAISREDLRTHRGKDKMEVIHILLGEKSGKELTSKQKIYTSFQSNVENAVDDFSLNEGALEFLDFLRKKEIHIGLGTGLSRDLFDKIFDNLHLKRSSFQYIGVASEVGRGRPHPDMIHDMMRKLKVVKPSSILKVGDTVADVLEGKNAQTKTAALLSGTHRKEDLIRAQPDYIIEYLKDLESLID